MRAHSVSIGSTGPDVYPSVGTGYGSDPTSDIPRSARRYSRHTSVPRWDTPSLLPTGLECRPLTPHRARLHYSERLWKRLLSLCLQLAILGGLLGLLYGAIAGGLDRDARMADHLRSEVAAVMGGAR
jgi:hypothetical protein